MSATEASSSSRTNWALIYDATHGDAAPSNQALELLVRRYWPAVYAYVRKSGRDVHEARALRLELIYARLSSCAGRPARLLRATLGPSRKELLRPSTVESPQLAVTFPKLARQHRRSGLQSAPVLEALAQLPRIPALDDHASHLSPASLPAARRYTFLFLLSAWGGQKG